MFWEKKMIEVNLKILIDSDLTTQHRQWQVEARNITYTSNYSTYSTEFYLDFPYMDLLNRKD